MARERRIYIDIDGVPVGGAIVAGNGGDLCVQFFVSAGHLPAAARHDLVEATFELPSFTGGRAVHAAIPLGEPDLMSALSQHLQDMTIRAAGATCLVNGVVSPKEMP